MAKKILIPALFFCVLFVSRAEAAMVSFLVVETGLTQPVPVREYSLLWENSLMDAFFDAGYIVSNASMLRLQSWPQSGFPQEVRTEMDNAIRGGAEFFIIARLDYDSAIWTANSISLQMFRLNPHEKIYERQLNARDVRANHDSITAVVRELIPNMR